MQATRNNLTWHKTKQNKTHKFYSHSVLKRSIQYPPTDSSPLSINFLLCALVLVCDFFFSYCNEASAIQSADFIVVWTQSKKHNLQLNVLLKCLTLIHQLRYPLLLWKQKPRDRVIERARKPALISWFLISGVPFLWQYTIALLFVSIFKNSVTSSSVQAL